MVTAGKVFKLVEPTPLSDLASRLSGYRREEEYEEGDYKFSLITKVVGLMPRENALTGVYSHDYKGQKQVSGIRNKGNLPTNFVI